MIRRGLGARLFVMVPIAVLHGGAHAQANGSLVDQEMTLAVDTMCTTSAAANTFIAAGFCSSPPASRLNQLAPDKFVTQSVSALGNVRQQFGAAQARVAQLGGLAAAPFGSPLAGTSFRVADAGPGTLDISGRPQLALTATAAPEQTSGSSSEGAIEARPLGVYLHVQGRHDDGSPTRWDPHFTTTAASVVAGADYQFSTQSVLGLSLNYDQSHSNFDVLGDQGGGSMQSHGTGGSLYGAWYPGPLSYVDATLNVGASRYSTVRLIPAMNDTAFGGTRGHQSGLDVGGGWTVPDGAFSYGPYARLAWTHTSIGGFSETEANASQSGLVVQSQQATSVESTIGAQVSRNITMGWGILVPSLRLEWLHQFRDDRTRNLLASFVDDPGQSNGSEVVSTVATTPADRNYFNLGLGLAAHFDVGRSAFIYFRTDMGHGSLSSQAVVAEARMEF